jgi:2-polyprenyl-3-methyl-5-hydroxy-6-metoxy-1,4-benzoquinol methylase
MQWLGRRLKLKFMDGVKADSYDDSFWASHRDGDWDGLARIILTRFGPRSVLDVGCGEGNLLESFRSINQTLKVWGIDGSPHAIARAQSRALNVLQLDITLQDEKSICDTVSSLGEFDLAVCLETAEHIPAWHTRKLMDILTHYDLIVFSAAHPNQGGVLHVNEQPRRFWIKRFKRYGFEVAECNEVFRAEVARLTLPSWYRENIMVLARVV